MSLEQDIIDQLIARVSQACPEFQGRVSENAHFSFKPEEWPCARVQMPDVSVETRDGGQPGRRPRRNVGRVIISVIHDGRDGTADAVQRELCERIDAELMADPYLRKPDGKDTATDLILSGTGAGTTRDRGTIVAVKQLYYSVAWRATEANPRVPTHA